MRILGRLFKKKPVVQLDDPVFGRITLDQGLWTFIPSPPADGFMINVVAPDAGPTAEQRVLFQEVRSRLTDYECLAREYMRSRVDAEVDVSRLSTYSVVIGTAEETARREFVLELSDSEAIVIHRVSFRADEPVDYGFDD